MKQFVRIVFASLLVLVASALSRQEDEQQHSRKKARQEQEPVIEPSQAAPKPVARRPAAAAPRGQIGYPTPAAVTPRARRSNPSRSTLQNDEPDRPQIKTRHGNFHAQPKPQQAPPVAFDRNRRIKGSEHWPGERYAAFRSYQPHWHDRAWYHKHCGHIVFICGGYYYWDNFYWYPAWGYNPFYSYYVYDGPIYAATAEESPDQVIADVQSALQELGYFDDEVDGILGETTRNAIAAYQSENGLYQTGAIDQPTLESLGLG